MRRDGPAIAQIRAVRPTPSTKLSVRIESRVAARRELLQALLVWLDAAREDDGVIEAHIYEDAVSAGVFRLDADVATGAAMEKHVHSEPFAVLLGAFNVLAQDVHMSISKLTSDFGPEAFHAIRSVCFDGDREEPLRKNK
jgi:quinol monooxygenase YgiN